MKFKKATFYKILNLRLGDYFILTLEEFSSKYKDCMVIINDIYGDGKTYIQYWNEDDLSRKEVFELDYNPFSTQERRNSFITIFTENL